MEHFAKEFGVPHHHIKTGNTDERFFLLVDKSWLKFLGEKQKIAKFPHHPKLNNYDLRLENPWTRVTVQCYKKNNQKVVSLPSVFPAQPPQPPSMTYSQLVNQIGSSNFKNLWEAGYRNYDGAHSTFVKPSEFTKSSQTLHSLLLPYDVFLKKVIQMIFRCPVISLLNDVASSVSDPATERITNVVPALCAIETTSHIFVIFYPPVIETTLFDCITFSPAVLRNTYNKPLFLIYQLLHLVKNLHEMGVFIGNLRLQDIYMKENLWLECIPRIECNMILQESEFLTPTSLCEEELPLQTFDLKFAYDLDQFTLREYCEMWCNGQLSNFDYLTILNNATGRNTSSEYHHIMPWVTDFSSRNGQNWRDLTKSKYRLNKGDAHLDHMFASSLDPSSAHHVSDFLSDITYYVYMARRTPKEILTQHVRPIWVPAEYPVSIQRLQEWTPDECIPEFYSDPNVFRSIHEDLPDLELPTWATCPEDFIAKHREALESHQVSKRLHYWIDLNFGCKLTGKPAVKSKNVCLSLVDEHKNLCQRGVVQLFTHAHPAKRIPPLFSGRTAPRISIPVEVGKPDGKIILPKDYNPTAMLQSLENMKSFMSKTFNGQKFDESKNESKLAQNDLLFEESSESFTNQLFQEEVVVSPKIPKTKNLIVPNVKSLKSLKELVKDKKDNELMVVACLAIEIFMFPRIRPQTQASVSLSFEERFQACKNALKQHPHDLPKCLHHVIGMILKNERKAVTDDGLPFPSVQQLLEPNLTNYLVPFPKFYPRVYHLIKYLKTFDFNTTIIDLKHHFNCNGQECSKYKDIDRNRVVLSRRNAENKVKSFCMLVEPLLQPKAFEQYDSLELLLPHAIELLENEETSILAAWYLFDPIATAIGVDSTKKHFLEPILKLFDCDVGHQSFMLRKESSNSVKFSTSSSFKSRKSVKLYHHTFLLRLIVRFGLKCFLENFIPPLVEAVGGFKEPEPHTGFHYHSQEERTRTRRSLQMCNNDESENSLTLISPTEHSVSFDATTPSAVVEKPDIEDVFSFDDDASGSGSDKQVNIFVDADVKSIDSKTSEEALDYSNLRSPEKLALNDIIFGHSRISNNSFEELASSPAETPVIPIPTTLRRTFELTTIDCEVGSKKSVDSFDFGGRVKEKSQERSADKEKEESPPLSVSASVVESNRISEMSMESLIWLSHRLGPVLTAKYLSKNLLKLLTLCYVNQENLMPENFDHLAEGNGKLNYFTIVDGNVFGDKSALKILECLMNVAALYGEQFILVQYLPYICEIVTLCRKKVTPSLEGALISSLQFIKSLIPCLMDSTIMEHLQETILDNILSPILNLIGTSRISLPSNYLSRNVLARKFIDVVYTLSVRIGPEMTKEHLSPHIIQHFFIIFDKVYGNIEHLKTKESFSISPPGAMEPEDNIQDTDLELRERSFEEIRDVFSPSLAHSAYLAFLKFLGEFTMSKTLINFDLILALCHEFELSKNPECKEPSDESKLDSPEDEDVSLTFGSNTFGTKVIGNRIAVANKSSKKEVGSMEVLDMVAWKFDHINVNRHLRGNWLAYWMHEISRNEKDEHLSVKQIKLQTFTGHSGSIRSILGLDNENSFVSASKDKTVKLWSLRSEGDGKKLSNCQFTYNAHKKSVHSLAFLESMRYVASCDSGVHLWDPFIGRPIGILDSHKLSPVTVIKAYPSPSALIVAGTAESTVKLIDSRTVEYVAEWRVTGNQGNTVRSIACSPSGKWIAVALSSGIIYILDARTGLLSSSWRATDAEILQLVAIDDRYLVSSSLDHSLSLWDVTDSSLTGQLKEPSEPAHCLQVAGSDLVYATPANRVGVSSNFLSKSPIHCTTRLRSETLKGILTSLAVLPLNRMILTGNDSGNIVLLC